MQSIQFASDKKISKASTKGQAVTCIQKSLTTFIYCISTIKLCLLNHMITNTWCLTMKNCDKRISLLKILFKNFSNSLQWIHIHVTMTHMCSPAKDYNILLNVADICHMCKKVDLQYNQGFHWQRWNLASVIIDNVQEI